MKPSDEDKLVLLFLGRFRALSTAESVIELLSFIEKSHPDMYEKVEVHSFGDLEDFEKILASEKGHIDKFITRQKVTHEEVGDEIDQANALLLSTKPERDDIIPAKLFDYLPSGKPILSLVENPEVKTIIEDTKTGLHTGHSQLKEASDFLYSIYNGELSNSPDLDKVMEYSAKHRAEELDQVLRKVLSDVG
jgi:transcription termination factor NusB